MGSEEIGQLSVLNHTFRDVLAELTPRRLAVLGCSTGNGFEHIDPGVTRRVVGIDINPDYLDILRHRHGLRLPGLELVCTDVLSCHFAAGAFDLIHAALFFEYVEPAEALPRAAGWLQPGGALSVVLQLPSPVSKMVSETPYTSLKALESIMRLVDPVAFEDLAKACDLTTARSWRVDLKLGKQFHAAVYQKA
jgi:SAM-dependent methyltransferase